MLQISKDLTSKCFDWRGVGRGAERRHPHVSNLQNSFASLKGFGSRLTPANRLNFNLSKNAENGFEAASSGRHG